MRIVLLFTLSLVYSYGHLEKLPARIRRESAKQAAARIVARPDAKDSVFFEVPL